MWDLEAARRLGGVIRELRTEQGLSQEALAHRAGITKNLMHLIESGRTAGAKGTAGPSNPRMTTIAGIAAALDHTVSDLLREARL